MSARIRVERGGFGTDIDARHHLELRGAFEFIRLAGKRVRFGPMVEADGFFLRGALTAPQLTPPIPIRRS